MPRSKRTTCLLQRSVLELRHLHLQGGQLSHEPPPLLAAREHQAPQAECLRIRPVVAAPPTEQLALQDALAVATMSWCQANQRNPGSKPSGRN
jgi:hypothetical protein